MSRSSNPVHKKYHMCVSVRGALKRPLRELNYFTDDDGKPISPTEARDWLFDELKQGHEVIPVGECEGFDYAGGGCPGHIQVPAA